MLNRPLFKYLVAAAAVYVGLHALCIERFPAHAMQASYPFGILAPWLALAACWGVARPRAVRTRFLWTLLCAALLIWAAGMLFSAWEDLFERDTITVAYFSDFLFFFYGAPMLLAISSPTEGERIPLFLWLDALQALMTAFLAYVTIFSIIPFTHEVRHPLPVSLLVITYNMENIVLAGVATLRLLATRNDGEERRFYQVLCSFLWSYAVLVGWYNRMGLALNGHMGLYDLLVEPAFLILAIVAVVHFAHREQVEQPIRRKPLGLFIDNVSPIFFSLALLALGAVLVRQHFYIGISGIVLALAVYGVRATLLQNRYMQAQHDLKAARDQMEAMSLTDSLTGVANRRCFDRTLEVEWRRAVRRRSPLSLLMIDVDYFKNINDRHGHPYGDGCLVKIADALRSALPRSADLLARYGGEEFAVILSATDSRGAEIVAQRMREFVRAASLENPTKLGQCVTISIGVAAYEFPREGTPAAFVEAADAALYAAKNRGRDRIEYAPS